MKQISQDSEKKRNSFWSAAARRRFSSVWLDAPGVGVRSNFSLSPARQVLRRGSGLAGPGESGVPATAGPHSKLRSPLTVFLGLIFLAMAVQALADSPPQVYGFEEYASNTQLSVVSGWAASSNSVVVLPSNSIPVSAGTNAVVLPVMTAASNLVQAASPVTVWTDLQVKEDLHMLDGIPMEVNSNAIVQLFMKTNGAITVYDKIAGQWLSYSNDVWGNAVTGFYGGGWARVSVLENFPSNTAAIFLNGHLMRPDLAFITNRTAYAGFTLQGNSKNPVYLDEVQIQTNVPASLTNDVDQDGMADAEEMQTYNNVTTWRRWTNTVSASAGGAVTPGTLTYTNGTVVVNDFQANSGYVISLVQSNGVSVGYDGDITTGTVAYVMATDMTFSVSFAAKSLWLVPDDVATFTRAVSFAAAGNTIIASNGLTTSESVTLDKALTLTGTNVTMSGTLTVSNGVTASMNSASNWGIGTLLVTNDAVLIMVNSTVTFTNLAFSSSGVLRVTNGTVTANGVTLTGTFTLDSNFGAAGIAPSHLNFWDDFELYALNTRVDALKMFGWGASAVGVVIQSNTTYPGGYRTVLLPSLSSVTNTISSSGYSNVWTECAVNESNGMLAGTCVDVNTNAVIQLYLTTNRYVGLYNRPLGQWQIHSNDVWGSSLSGVYSNGFAHIAINQNYTTKKVAVFLNGHLVCQQFDFINTNQLSYTNFNLKGSEQGVTYMDNVGFSTNVPSSLTSGPASDLDHDGIADAVEIAQYGTTSLWPRGAVFKIR